MLRRNTAKKAFTLVELLVVISIIAMLSAILLPAVNSAREAARQSTCSNNMRQLGTAVQNYQASKGDLPDYLAPLVPSLNAPSSNSYATTYVWQLLPFIEKNQIRDYANDTLTEFPNADPLSQVEDKYIKLLVCASDAKIDNASGPMSYVPNGGMRDTDATGASISPDWRDNGAMGRSMLFAAGNSNSSSNQIPFNNTLDFISSRDGASTTIMITETTRAVTWIPALVTTPDQLKAYEAQSVVVWTANSSDGFPTSSEIPFNTNLGRTGCWN